MTESIAPLAVLTQNAPIDECAATANATGNTPVSHAAYGRGVEEKTMIAGIGFGLSRSGGKHMEPMQRPLVMTDETEVYRYQGHDLPYFPTDFGFKWPNRDESLAGDLHTLRDVDEYVLPHVQRWRVVVQAGGAVGVWPKRFAQLFQSVYTFEPYPESFHCLCVNCPELNVFKFNAALGETPGWAHMGFPEHVARSQKGKENIGGYRVLDTGHVPILKLDSFSWDTLDLLYLDLEGFELFALRGAIATIRRCKPIIVLEDKAGCCQTFGYKVGDVERLLHKEGYYTINRFHGGRDVILGPRT